MKHAILSFTSWIKEMDMVMAGLDFVALSSFNEGTPVSLIEAPERAGEVRAALRWLKAGEDNNRAPSMKAVRSKCQEVNMAERGEENLPPRQAKIKELVTLCDGGRITGYKGGTWEIGAAGLLRVEAGPRWTWHTCLVWGQIPTDDLLRIKVSNVEMPEQITWEEFKKRSGYKGHHPVAQVAEAWTPAKEILKTEPAPDYIQEITVPDRPSYDPDEVPF